MCWVISTSNTGKKIETSRKYSISMIEIRKKAVDKKKDLPKCLKLAYLAMYVILVLSAFSLVGVVEAHIEGRLSLPNFRW